MPAALLHAYMTMLPRLEAQETLMKMMSTSLGSGFGGDETMKTIKLLQAQALGKEVKEEITQKVAGRQFAAMMGIPIRVHRKKPVEGA